MEKHKYDAGQFCWVDLSSHGMSGAKDFYGNLFGWKAEDNDFIDANLSLTVTPHITPDGSVLMQIKASRNSIGSFRTASGEPSINKKEASTEVLVRDGETTVIGGIVVSDSTHTDRGIPLLQHIPVFGWLFKNKSVSDTQTELLIFLTPTIMKEQVIG